MSARLILILLLVLCASTLSAQTPTPAEPSYDPPPLRLGPVTFSGYLQADALTVTGDDLDEASDTFRVRRARVAVGGDLAPKLAFAVSVELAGSPHLRDAYLTVRFTEQFQVRLGQLYPNYSLERMTSSSRLEVVDRTRMTEALTYERNPGVMLLNARPLAGWLSYSIGAFNGTGMNRSDNNDAKDVIGRIVITPPALRGISVGISGGAGAQPDGDRDRATMDVTFDRGPVKVIVEGMLERYAGVERDGYYVLGAYRIHPATVTPHFRMAELVVRFVSFDDPTGIREAMPTRSFVPETTRELQFGGNYYVNRNVRLQANAIVPVDDREAPGATMIARLQVIF